MNWAWVRASVQCIHDLYNLINITFLAKKNEQENREIESEKRDGYHVSTKQQNLRSVM